MANKVVVGKGTWKPMSVTPSPDRNSSPVGGTTTGSDKNGAGVTIVQPFMPDTPKRPGSGIGGKHPNHEPNPTPNPQRDDANDGTQNTWYGPKTVPTVKTEVTPNPEGDFTYGGYDGGFPLNDIDSVTGAGETDAILD